MRTYFILYLLCCFIVACGSPTPFKELDTPYPQGNTNSAQQTTALPNNTSSNSTGIPVNNTSATTGKVIECLYPENGSRHIPPKIQSASNEYVCPPDSIPIIQQIPNNIAAGQTTPIVTTTTGTPIVTTTTGTPIVTTTTGTPIVTTNTNTATGIPKKPKLPVLFKKADIVFILDTSSSMEKYITNIFAGAFHSFIRIIDRSLDWKWMYTNASAQGYHWSNYAADFRPSEVLPLEDGRKTLSFRARNDKQQLFMEAITREPDRSNRSHEELRGQLVAPPSYPPFYSISSKPLTALQLFFSRNQKHIRSNATFVAVIITNSDEESSSSTNADTVIAEFKKVYGADKRLLVFNLLIPSQDNHGCLEKNKDYIEIDKVDNSIKPGTNIEQLAKKTNGGNYSICSKNYSDLARDIVLLISQQKP